MNADRNLFYSNQTGPSHIYTPLTFYNNLSAEIALSMGPLTIWPLSRAVILTSMRQV